MFKKSFVTILLSIASLIVTQKAANAVIFSGGDVVGIGRSVIYLAVPGVYNGVYGLDLPQTDGAIHLRLDMGTIQNVSSLQITNQLAFTETNLTPLTFTIYVAPDELAIGFDPNLVASYSQVVFSDGMASGYSNLAGAVQTVDVTDFTKRYVLIDVTSNGFGLIEQSANRDTIMLSNINYTVVPEPSTCVLLGLSFGLALLFRRRRLLL